MNHLDHVVLVDDDGNVIGSAPKISVHDAQTPLHLAFSCHLSDDSGRVLVTRRALSKRTWPGVWTNSFCGHPRPGESIEDAVRRHARNELGVQITDLEVILPDFRYRAVDADGIVENEICPVFSARLVGDLAPHPDEVAEVRWSSPDDLATAIQSAPWAFSPWLVLQAAALTATPLTPEYTP